MSRNQVKIIAIIAMVICHINRLFPGFFGIPSIFLTITNNIDPLTFTLMAYLLVEGFEKSSNVNKYILRMFIFALISQIPFVIFATDLKYLFVDGNWRMLFIPSYNVLFTLFFALVYLKIYKESKSKFLRIFGHVLNLVI